MNLKKLPLAIILTALTILTACGPAKTLDGRLQEAIATQQITPLPAPPPQDPAQVALGQLLFFDKIISGNHDVSCATCHHPSLASSDNLPLSIGVGGFGLGPFRRANPERAFIPRNAPEIFNRGVPGWNTMFWDSRVEFGYDGDLMTPAGNRLPDGLTGVLAAQAMFPPTSRDEMRGLRGDTAVDGTPNELANIIDTNLNGIWNGITDRLLANPEYVALFQAAYPDIPVRELGFEHAANAIAAFETDAFTFLNSPWQRYLHGDLNAMSPQAKQGALLFYGTAGCAACHSGPLMTDQQTHIIAAPQVGPGKNDDYGLDYGRFLHTGNSTDKYAFRTPPLHNVALTGPWTHAGAYSTLEAVIRHHMDPEAALRTYDPTVHLPLALQNMLHIDPEHIQEMTAHLDPKLAPVSSLTPSEITALVAFLEALTDPAAQELNHLIPSQVPSGLPVNN